ncbi:MAG: hypothetical protein ABID61_05425 [Candidatus Micrarchaeota archaeon]
MKTRQHRHTLMGNVKTMIAITALTVITAGPMGCMKPKSATDALLEACRNGKPTVVQVTSSEQGINVKKPEGLVAKVLIYFGKKPPYKEEEQRGAVILDNRMALCPKGGEQPSSPHHIKNKSGVSEPIETFLTPVPTKKDNTTVEVNKNSGAGYD